MCTLKLLLTVSFSFFPKKAQDPTKNITHVVLNCLAGNLILYLCYYLLRKKCCHTTEAEYIKEKYKERKWELTSKCSIPALISPGTFFTFLALVFAVIGKEKYQLFVTALYANSLLISKTDLVNYLCLLNIQDVAKSKRL